MVLENLLWMGDRHESRNLGDLTFLEIDTSQSVDRKPSEKQHKSNQDGNNRPNHIVAISETLFHESSDGDSLAIEVCDSSLNIAQLRGQESIKCPRNRLQNNKIEETNYGQLI